MGFLHRLPDGSKKAYEQHFMCATDQPCVALRSTLTEGHGGAAKTAKINSGGNPGSPRLGAGTTCGAGALFQLSAHKSKMPGHGRSYCQTGPVFQTKMNAEFARRAQKATVEQGS